MANVAEMEIEGSMNCSRSRDRHKIL